MPIPSVDRIPPCPDVPGLPIFRCLAGSHAYGMDTPESDIDVRGIFVPSKVYILGATKNVEQVEGHPDTVMYAIQKYFQLARNANPNILELLFCPDDCIIESTWHYGVIKDHRNLFLSQKARFTYSGYAFSQLKRIKTHRRWLLEPPTKKPMRSDYGLPDVESLIPREQVGAFYITLAHVLRDVAEFRDLHSMVLDIVRSEQFPGWEGIIQRGGIPIEAMPMVQKLTGASDNFIDVLQHEQAFYNASNEWKKYNEWKVERNPARAALEAKWGVDVKHASHLVRLMQTGETLMTTGELVVRPDNAKELRRIRDGVWLDGMPVTYDKIESYAEMAEARIRELYDSGKCVLPKSPDVDAIDRLCMSVIEDAWRDDV